MLLCFLAEKYFWNIDDDGDDSRRDKLSLLHITVLQKKVTVNRSEFIIVLFRRNLITEKMV